MDTPRVKSPLKWTCLGCAGLMTLAVASCGTLVYLGYRAANESVTPVVDELFAAIEAGDFGAMYDKHASAELRATVTKAGFEALGRAIDSRLGALESKGLQGFNSRWDNGKTTMEATYDATFEKGAGTISIAMVKQGEDWKIDSFRVNSPIFEQDLATETCPHCGAAHTPDAKLCPDCGEELPEEGEAVLPEIEEESEVPLALSRRARTSGRARPS